MTIVGASSAVQAERRIDRDGCVDVRLVALILGLGALVVAGQALTRSDDAKRSPARSTGTQVTLKEFTIDPSMIAVDSGGRSR